MKIGILMTTPMISPTGGVRIQAVMWHDGLKSIGHDVELINNWEVPDWSLYDAIIIFDFGGSYRLWMKWLPSINSKLAVAPIIDPTTNKYIFKFLTKYWGSQKYLGLTSRFHDLYLGSKNAQIFFTRSNEETEYLSYCCDVPKGKIFQIPLSVRFQPLNEMPEKDNFCFHSSRLYAKNKNVERLIAAAKKYGFQLKLAGILNGQAEKDWFYEQIKDCENIEYVGLVSDEELQNWYKRAKVFALPSLSEGVGMVALEAAGHGAEIVLTNVGAPKEYFNGMAALVDPYSVDEIGSAIMRCLNGEYSKQPELMKFVDNNYSVRSCSMRIADALQNMK